MTQSVDSAYRYLMVYLRTIPVRSSFHCPHAWQILRWETEKTFWKWDLAQNKEDRWENVLLQMATVVENEVLAPALAKNVGRKKRWGYPKLLPSCCLKLLEKIQGTQAITLSHFRNILQLHNYFKTIYTLPLNNLKRATSHCLSFKEKKQ